jgi:hypothetical protein
MSLTSAAEVEALVEDYNNQIKDMKDEIFRLGWYMRGGVNTTDLFYLYSPDDRKIMQKIVKDNIEATKQSQMPLL